jgi:hypothetical protein
VGHEKKKKGLKKDRKVRGAVTQHTAYITEAPRGASRTISLCSVPLFAQIDVYLDGFDSLDAPCGSACRKCCCDNSNCDAGELNAPFRKGKQHIF